MGRLQLDLEMRLRPVRVETAATATNDNEVNEPTNYQNRRGRVPGIDGAKFDEIADQAKAGCPVSRVLKADITLTKKLET